MVHRLVFFLSALILFVWLVAAGTLSGYYPYYLGAVLVLAVFFFSMRGR
jgi:hypothetical protein